MKKMLIICISIFILCLSGCQTNHKPYLSITTNCYNDNGELVFHIYKYLIRDNQKENKLKMKHESQYPLGTYSQYDNTVYYAAECDESHGNQLYSYNLDTKSTEMLTDEFFAIHQIIPVENQIYLLGVVNGSNLVKPAIYNLRNKKLEILNEKDNLFFSNMVLDIFNKNIYLSAYDQSEDDKAMEEANEGKGRKYISPNTHIYKLNNKKLDKIYSTNRKLIYRMLPESNGNLTITESESIPAWNPEYFTYTLDIKEDKKSPSIDLDDIMSVSEFAYYVSNHEIVFLGTQTENEDNVHRAIYLFNTETKRTELLFEPEDEYISNFTLLYE